MSKENESHKMKIGILLCGHIPQELIGQYDDYDVMFKDLLSTEHFTYQTWAVVDNQLPDSATDADGWLITGSKHGTYEEHDWIAPLESHIRAAYNGNIPLVGICFGHQIMAQALGGTVSQFDGGWSAGHVDYTVEGAAEPVGIHAFHQDQIIVLPPEASVTGSTPFCQYAFLDYKNAAISMQPHPEITDEYLRDLLAARGKALPQDVVSKATASIGRSLSTQAVAADMTKFFLENRQNQRQSNSQAHKPSS